MLHHISVAVDNPLHVAEVLAEVWAGRFFPFPSHPGSYIVLANDEYGTAIELYPSGTQLIPGEEVQFQNATSLQFVPFHAAISVPTILSKIEEIGQREGWRVKLCDRGASPTENRGLFHVIEFWVENKLLLEFLSPEIVSEYLEFTQPHNFEAFFAATQTVATM